MLYPIFYLKFLQNNFTMLKKEFMNMQPPPGLEDLGDLFPEGLQAPSCSSSASALIRSASNPTGNSAAEQQLPPPATPTTAPPPEPVKSAADEDEKMSVDV